MPGKSGRGSTASRNPPDQPITRSKRLRSIMRRHLTLAGLVVCVAVAAESPATAQSLTDVARKEETRRKSVRAPAKVYTNDDLLHSGDSASNTKAAANTP